MTSIEMLEIVKNLEVAVQKAKEGGDLRENAEWQELTIKLEEAKALQARVLQTEAQKKRLKVQWKPPTEVSDIVVMGAKIHVIGFDKPIVILPKYEFDSTEAKYTDVYICSTESDFSIENLGSRVKKNPNILRIERWLA